MKWAIQSGPRLGTLGKATSFPGSLISPPPWRRPWDRGCGKGGELGQAPMRQVRMPVISLRERVNHRFQSYFIGCSGWKVTMFSCCCCTKKIKKRCQVHFKKVSFRSQIKFKPSTEWSPLGNNFKLADECPWLDLLAQKQDPSCCKKRLMDDKHNRRKLNLPQVDLR